MENRLFEAARTGNVGELRQLLQENPLILADFALISPHENPLHIATKAGQLDFVREIITQKPELAKELNQDGFRPMDIASAFGYIEIVREFLSTIGPEICRMMGRDGRTALHHAALHGRVEIIDELLSACSESIKDVTVLDETALHLAVKYYKIGALRRFIWWLEHLGTEDLVNLGDRDGNTVLHLAVSGKQLESVKLLLCSSDAISKLLKLNALNSRGLTAMDILDIHIESHIDAPLRQILRRAGAQDTKVVSQEVATINQTASTPAASKDWIKILRFDKERDLPSDTRNVLLVVAALIATVTFQAGVNPPSDFLQENQNGNPASPPPPVAATPLPPQARRFPALTYGIATVFANSALATSTWFVLGNTMGLTASLSIIIYLTSGFPFQRELQLSIYSMMFAYGCSIEKIQPHGVMKYLFLGISFFLPFALRWLPRWIKKAWNLRKQRSRDQTPPGNRS